jgi:hypothetical protein
MAIASGRAAFRHLTDVDIGVLLPGGLELWFAGCAVTAGDLGQLRK